MSFCSLLFLPRFRCTSFPRFQFEETSLRQALKAVGPAFGITTTATTTTGAGAGAGSGAGAGAGAGAGGGRGRGRGKGGEGEKEEEGQEDI